MSREQIVWLVVSALAFAVGIAAFTTAFLIIASHAQWCCR